MTHRLIAIVILLASIACAQIGRGSSDVVTRLRIRVELNNHSACDSSIRVALVGNTGFEVAETQVNSDCVAELYDVPSGRYRVTVKGRNIANADDGRVDVNSVILQELEVRASHTQGSDLFGAIAGASFVSVKDLQMPSGAAKEFERAGHLIDKQDWEGAYGHLRKGLSNYSSFAAGYNNLGAVYVHLGKLQLAEEALQEAIRLDDRLGAAYVNLARVRFLQKDYPQAESLLRKAVSVAPIEGTGELALLAYAELTDMHLSEAVATSREGHSLQLKQHAYLHLVAARAYEQQSKIADAISELKSYLIEEPGSAQAGKVKGAIAMLETQVAVR